MVFTAFIFMKMWFKICGHLYLIFYKSDAKDRKDKECFICALKCGLYSTVVTKPAVLNEIIWNST